MSDLNKDAHDTAGDIVIAIEHIDGSCSDDDPSARTVLLAAEYRPDDTDTVIDIPEQTYETDCEMSPCPDRDLDEWISFHEKNGIVQHSAEWLAAKRFVIGGSKIAMVEGTCPHAVVGNYVREKSAGITLPMGIAAHWGNLMEEIVKQQVERDYECTVLGENLFVRDPTYKGVAYSPDGLATMIVSGRGSCPNRGGSICNLLPAENEIDRKKSARVVLVEFKCPWSRVLDGIPPANYVPQVKMGLDMIRIASLGLLVEAVYRRCTVPQLYTNEFNDAHTINVNNAPKSPYPCIYSGIIGVMVHAHPVVTHNLYDDWPDWYRAIQNWRTREGADFGKMPADIFGTLMDAIDRHDLSIWYPRGGVSADLSVREFTGCCKESGCIMLGIIPWKLLRIDYHWVAPEYGYIDKVGPRIDLINTAIIDAINNPRNAHNIISDFDTEWEALTGVSASSRGSLTKNKQM